MSRRDFPVALLSAALVLAMSVPAFAQTGTTTWAPSWDSAEGPGGPASGNYNTPEADGRPGEYFFQLGSDAFRRKDYDHAVAMYKAAASWAYKPAEYDLALMYFRGTGVPVDRALGAAWMVLAAERNNSKYAHARDLMITALSNAEFAQTNLVWQKLKPIYGDEVALHRAKLRWAQVKAGMTGSRVGDGAVYLLVGGGDYHGPASPSKLPIGLSGVPTPTSGWGAIKGSITDGSIAYRQLHSSDNPYDPQFLKNRAGHVDVGPLAPVNTSNDQSKKDDGVHNL
jgi:hypothetical protein